MFDTPMMPLPKPMLLLLLLLFHADPQAFQLDCQVVGEGVLDAAAEHPADVVVVVLAKEPASADRGSEHGRRRTDVERCRKLAAVRHPEEAVVVIAIVGEGETTGGVDEHAISCRAP